MKRSIRITKAEWEVMSVVWKKAPVAASDIVSALSSTKQWTLATVRTLLRRLVNKGALSLESEGKRYLYSALVTLEECAKSEGESMLDRLMGRTPSSVLIHMVEKSKLSKEDIRELKRILRDKEK